MFKRKIIKNGGSFQLTIPTKVMEATNWKKGEMMMIELLDNGIMQVYSRRDHRNLSYMKKRGRIRTVFETLMGKK